MTDFQAPALSKILDSSLRKQSIIFDIFLFHMLLSSLETWIRTVSCDHNITKYHPILYCFLPNKLTPYI